MSELVTRALARIMAVAFGLLWGFFVAFNVVFSDVFGLSDMVGAVAFVLVAYFGLGLVYGVLGPKTGVRWTGWIAAPGALFALLMISDNPSRIGYTASVVAAVVGGTLLGSWLGSSLRRRLDTWSARRHPSGGDSAATG